MESAAAAFDRKHAWALRELNALRTARHALLGAVSAEAAAEVHELEARIEETSAALKRLWRERAEARAAERTADLNVPPSAA